VKHVNSPFLDFPILGFSKAIRIKSKYTVGRPCVGRAGVWGGGERPVMGTPGTILTFVQPRYAQEVNRRSTDVRYVLEKRIQSTEVIKVPF
jgi:hypothetical protein